MKQRNRYIHFFIVSVLILFIGNSCSKNYLNVNNDPNRVTDANITAELIFPQAENAVGQLAGSGSFRFLDEWMGYFAPNGGFVPEQNIISYNIDFSFGDALFQNYYGILFDLHQAEVKGYSGGDSVLSGASIILQAKLFQELVDLYGDVPYTQAFQTNTYTTPAYDKSQDIYTSLQNRLDTGIMYMQLTAKKAFAPADIINKGDQTKWIKFANTLKLRLLIRQSQITGFDPSAQITKIQATGGVLGAGESISVNPGYVNDVSKQNPYYSNFGWDPVGNIADNATDANSYVLNILQTTSDPRLSRFFYPVGFTGSTYVGNTLGDQQANNATSANSSYFGPGLVGQVNGSNVGQGFSQDQFIYPSYESMFLYAEAVARGWIAGDANAALAAAITESFVWLGVPNATTAAATYIADNPSIATIPASVTLPLAKAKIVVYQKYIANTGIDPLESYSDLRRLNFLTDNSYISIAPGKISNTLPLRLLYPQSEYTTNSKNVPKEVAGDAFSSKLFWEP